jgi:hypothetical protein
VNLEDHTTDIVTSMFGRFNIIKTNLEVSSQRLAIEAVALSNHEDMKRLMQEQQERFVSEVSLNPEP